MLSAAIPSRAGRSKAGIARFCFWTDVRLGTGPFYNFVGFVCVRLEIKLKTKDCIMSLAGAGWAGAGGRHLSQAECTSGGKQGSVRIPCSHIYRMSLCSTPRAVVRCCRHKGLFQSAGPASPNTSTQSNLSSRYRKSLFPYQWYLRAMLELTRSIGMSF